MDVDDEDDADDPGYESGPFCVHWSELGNCTETCFACKHPCHGHGGCRGGERECACEETVAEPEEGGGGT